MKQIIIKHVKQKTKINRDLGKNYFNREKNEEEMNKINEEIELIKRAIRNRENRNKNFDDLF